jgi:hypothetical protein
LARGWSILPVGSDKRPLGKWSEYQQRAPTETEVDQWRARWPEAGIGILAGSVSGLLVVDIDAKDAESFAEAKRRVEECLPDGLVCPIVRTRSGGEHWYFRLPECGMSNRAHVDGLPLDVRGTGGYVVAPPTPGYSWSVSPYDCELPDAPPALLALLAMPRPQAHVPAEHRERGPGFSYVVERARRYIARMDAAVSGQSGHSHTYEAACKLVWGFGLDDCDAWDILCEYNQRCDPPWTEKELRHKLEDARKETRHSHPFGHLRDAEHSSRRQSEPQDEDDIGGGSPSDPRPIAKPTIRLGVDQDRVVREAIIALGRQKRYYSRGTSLYRILQPSSPEGDPRPLARLEIVPPASLAIALSAAANWEKVKGGPRKKEEGEDEDESKLEWVPATPPEWCVKGVHAAGQWAGLDPLVGVISTPCIRRDGSILNEPGYDRTTGLYYRQVGQVYPVRDRPTLEDAVAARDELLDVVKDFPFAEEIYRAAWLSICLTPFARHALRDSAPMGYIDANTRGSGKSLLATITAIIATGRNIPMSAFADDEEEREKRITTIVMEGAPVVIFDNIEGVIGGSSLNIILTSGSWIGRILGSSKSTGELPLRTTFLATGNNCDFAKDTPRRVIHVRLLSPLERPELRTGFAYPHLIEWVQEQRPRLAAAALTILRAYQVAGAPAMGLPAMGGYVDWSAIVRSAVAWVGMADPAGTQDNLILTSDRSTAELADLLAGIKAAQLGSTDWSTAQQLLVYAATPTGEDLRDALLEHAPDRHGGLPTARVMGMLLRRHVDRVHGGLVLRRYMAGNNARWRVLDADSSDPRNGHKQAVGKLPT